MTLALEQGYEGLIVRDSYSAYEVNQRSLGLLKLKEFEDAEYKIVAVEQGLGSFLGQAIFVCQLGADTSSSVTETFRVVIRGPHSYKQQLWATRTEHIGKLLTVRYQNLTDKGIPRFPIGVSIRDLNIQG